MEDTGASPRQGPLGWFAPARLGPEFPWLWASSAATNIGDGILLSAGPLLVTTITREPIAVAASVFLQHLPWVFFGIPAGAIIDRVDRRRLTWIVNAIRAVILAVLTATIATGTADLALVLGSMFLLGTAETFADNAGQALIATKVPKLHLGLANARLSGTRILANQLAGPPIGALLFGLGMWVPFGVNVICAALGAVMIARLLPTPARAAPAEPTHIRHEIRDGIRWLWQHPPIRALALTILFFNVTFGAAMAVFVLLAKERLGLDDVGYGLLITAEALGGLLASVAYPRLERRFALSTLMRVGLLWETMTHLILATTTLPVVAAITMGIFGVHAVMWGTLSTTVRQRAVPAAYLGRVTSVYMLAVVGGMAVGSVVGGVIAQVFGVTGPFWFAFFGSALLLVLIWRTLDDIAHAPAAEDEGTESPVNTPASAPSPG
jgi:MFS family permease